MRGTGGGDQEFRRGHESTMEQTSIGREGGRNHEVREHGRGRRGLRKGQRCARGDEGSGQLSEDAEGSYKIRGTSVGTRRARGWGTEAQSEWGGREGGQTGAGALGGRGSWDGWGADSKGGEGAGAECECIVAQVRDREVQGGGWRGDWVCRRRGSPLMRASARAWEMIMGPRKRMAPMQASAMAGETTREGRRVLAPSARAFESYCDRDSLSRESCHAIRPGEWRDVTFVTASHGRI